MLSCPAAIPLSTRSPHHLADLVRAHRARRRSRWRRLDPGRQALLTLAHPRNGDTLTRLARGFDISITTAWRYVREAINHTHARIRARGERANTTLKTWKVLAKLRCCPRHATAIVQAILVLHHVENPTSGR